MRALTVGPGTPDPPASRTSPSRRRGRRGPRRGAGAGRSAAPTARSLGRVRLGARGSRAARARPRVARRCSRRPTTPTSAGRPRRRHRAPPRPRAVRVLRGRALGHVPQRRLHRARHQGPRRLRLRALAHRARVRRRASTRARARRRAARAHQRRGQGLGRDRRRLRPRCARRPRSAVITGAGPIGLLAALLAVQRGLETHVLDLVTDGPKPQLVARPRRHLPRRSAARDRTAAGRRRRVHRRRAGRARRHRRRPPRPASSASPASRSGGRGLAVDAGALNRPSCSRTTSSSAPSTPTAATTSSRPRRSRAPTTSWLARLITRRVPLDDAASRARAPAATTSRSWSSSDVAARRPGSAAFAR